MNGVNKISQLLKTNSNKELYFVMKTCLHRGTIQEFFSISIVKKKLIFFLSFYNQGDKNAKIPDRKLKNKYPLSKNLQEYIHLLSSWFDLNNEYAFDLLEDFFVTYPKKAESFLQRETLMSSQSEDLKEKFQRYVMEFFEEIVSYYYQERLFLIDLLLQMIENSFGQFTEDNQQLREEMKDLINSKALYETLWRQFTSYHSKPIRAGMTSSKIIDYHSLQVLEEQSKILDCMSIIGNYLEFFSVPIFNGMIDYFGKNNMMGYGKAIVDKPHIQELAEKFKSLIQLILDKSIIFSLMNFKPKELYMLKTHDGQLRESLKILDLDYNLLSNYFESSLRETSPEPIHLSILALALIIKEKRIGLNQKPISDFSTLVDSRKNNVTMESGTKIIISIVERYSKIIKEEEIGGFFIYNYKYFIKNWLNLILEVIYPDRIYPLSLINLCSSVLDSELSRDEFYDYDFEVKTPIYQLFCFFINNNTEGNNISHLLNFCFSLLIQYPNSSNYNFIFDHLTERQENSILKDILRTWNEMNSLMEQSEDLANIKINAELIRLFVRLITWNTEISIRFILFNKIDNNETIVDSEIRKLHQNIIDLAIDSMTIIQSNREYTMSFSVLINELYHFFINMNDNYLREISSILIENRDKLTALAKVIYTTMYNDHYLKDYSNTMLSIKLISTFYSIENIIMLASTEIGQNFINMLWNLIIEVIKQFGKSNSFASIEECRIIEYVSEILIKIISLTKSSVKKTPFIINNQSESLVHFFISMINQVSISSFIFNFLRIKVYVDTMQSSSKNKFRFRNIFFDKIIKTHQSEQSEAIRSMIRNQMRCFSLMLDIILLFKGSKDNEVQSLLYNIEFVKEWNSILCINKSIPIFISDNINAFNTYDVNLILLLFTYCNYEEEVQMDYELSIENYNSNDYNNDNEDMNNVNYQEIIKYFSVSYNYAKDMNVTTLSYQVLSKILVIFSLSSSTSSNEQKTSQQQQQPQSNAQLFSSITSSPIVNIMNYLSMKKNMGTEIDSNFSIIEKIKIMIIEHFNSTAIFIKNEVIKFLAIAAATQFQFTSSIIDDLFSNQETYQNILDALNSKLESDDLMSLSGLLTMFFAKVFSNDMMYKQGIRLLSMNNKFINDFLSITMKIFELYIKNLDNNSPISFLSSDNLDFNGKTLLNVNKINSTIQLICFSDITAKNLCIIFTKMITLSEIVHKKQKAEFDFIENLFVFLLRFIAPMILNYKLYIPFSTNFSELNLRKIGIQIQNKEHIIINDQLTLMYSIDSVFNYGCSFFIDVRELNIESQYSFLKNKNNTTYNSIPDQIMGLLESLIANNCHLSLFDSKTQAMYAANYLLGLLYSIGPDNYSMTSSFYTSKRLFDQVRIDNAVNSSNNVLFEKIINMNQVHPKLGFQTRDFPNKLKVFMDKIFAEKFLDKLPQRDEHDNDYYSQFIILNYNIINHFFDFILFQLKSNKDQNTFVIQKDTISYIIRTLIKDVTYYLTYSEGIEISKLLLSIITLSYSVINYIILSKTDSYLFNPSDTEMLLNSLTEKMMTCYESQIEYRAVITYVFSSYCSIPYLKQNPKYNILFNDRFKTKSNIVRLILSKFNDQISDIEYQSFLMLLTNLINNYVGSFALIQQEKVFFYLKMKNNYSTLSEYDNNERSHNHLLWCWNLKFISCVLLNYSVLDTEAKLKYFSVYKASLDHFRLNEERVFKLFDYCGNTNINIQDINNGKAAKSLAFLEELNQVLNVLGGYYLNEFTNNNYSDSDNFEFYFSVIEVILLKGLTLFNSNIKQDKAYQPQSAFEQKMTEINIVKASTSFNQEKNAAVSTSAQIDPSFKLVKGYSYVPVSSVSNNTSSGSIKNLYSYKVKILLSKILFNMTNILSFLKTESQDRSSYFQYISTEYRTDRLMSFDFQCKNVVNASNYADFVLFEYNKNKDEYKKYDALLDLFNCNIDTGINFGFLNIIDDKEGDLDEILNEMSFYSLTQLLMFEIELNECVSFFSRKYQYTFDVQIKEHLGKSIQFFNKNEMSIDKKKEFEELFKEYQGKWNI